MNWLQKAKDRVDYYPELDMHRNTIMYDWPEADQHWQWIATAPIDEIMSWVNSVEAAEEACSDEDVSLTP